MKEYATSFPADIKGCMKDCILSLFWPRKDIVGFFEKHGCTKAELSSLQIEGENGLKRHEIIDVLFGKLDVRPDNGLGPFRAMLQSLLAWAHFDPYYFDALRKLDRAAATRNLDHLKQLQEIRDAKIKVDRERRANHEAARQQPTTTLDELHVEYLDLLAHKISRQQRGYALERILAELARLSRLETTEAFRVNGEQIDGAVKFDGEHYLIEAKWQEKSASNEPVYQFASKVGGKLYGRGLFISVNGFSSEVVRSLVIGKEIQTLFVDGEDLILILEGHLSFRDMMDRKVKAAQTKGLIYVHPISGAEKKA
ncbi:MAG: restriction endonuclease family protein [Hydrocarboniphaga sp.]|uniref:restriction endonuclease n=1 Tax=Hydrocarboniphaga sp. TaxID=2033016 RepID=UPI002602B49D|nr:restriction endonuclease [Hydrocarboniphaga sp.]MDB5971109.1 restriction endonuclease family protein [Hydrocarboniphaga sp.]